MLRISYVLRSGLFLALIVVISFSSLVFAAEGRMVFKNRITGQGPGRPMEIAECQRVGRGVFRIRATLSRVHQTVRRHEIFSLVFDGEVVVSPGGNVSGFGCEAKAVKSTVTPTNPPLSHDRSASLSTDRERIRAMVEEISIEMGVYPPLAHSIARVESEYNPTAQSRVNSGGRGRAKGVMQLLDSTARRFGVRNSFDPEQNIRGGLAYLKWLLDHFNGNVVLAVAAYNAGEGAVEEYGGIPPFRETQIYVRRVMRLLQ